MTTQISGDYVVETSDTETNTTDAVAYYLGPASSGGPDPTLTIKGSVLVTNATPYSVVGVVNSIYGFYVDSYFLVTSTGRFVVEDDTAGSSATGFSATSFSARVENDGYFSVTGGSGPGGAAQGIVASDFDGTNPDFPYDIKNAGTMDITAGDFAVGIRTSVGDPIQNSGQLTVQANDAYGIWLGGTSSFSPSTIDNSGHISVTSTSTTPSIGVFIDEGQTTGSAELFINSGVITADKAIWEASLRLSVHVENTGTLNGDIQLGGYYLPGDAHFFAPSEVDNSGLINGSVYFGSDSVIYSGANGTLTGAIHLGAGSAIVTLGNDGEMVQGGDGVAQISGGTGDDTYVLGSGSETILGGGGSDTVVFDHNYSAYQIGAVGGVLIVVGPNGIDSLSGITTLKFSDRTVQASDLSSSHQVLAGTPGDDALTGTGGNDTLIGLGGDDTLNGAAGNDLLGGGAGNDNLNGGSGNDTATYADATSGVVVNLLIAKAQNTGGAGSDTLTSIENATGSSYADQLTAGKSGSILQGLAGDDLLIAGAGNDTLDGGKGNDTASYALATSGVTVSLAAAGLQNTGGSGKDTLISIENLIGSKFGDVLTPGSGTESIDGGAGADIAVYSGHSSDYVIRLVGSGVTITGDGQTDTLTNVEAARFADEQAILSNSGGSLTARGAGDTLLGGFGNDKLTGGAGNDVLIGGRGDDTLNGGGGTNTAEFQGDFSYYAITAKNGVTTVKGGPDGTDTLQKIQILQFDDRQVVNGSAGTTVNARTGGDTLVGGAGGDHLNGSPSADTLIGGAGQDTLTGDGGADHFVFNALGDSPVKTPDLITDWTAGDRIDLSAIDADSKTAGHQAFHLQTTSGHTGDIAVHYDSAHGRTVIDLYVNNDAKPDAEIWLSGDHTLSAADFLL